MLFNLIIYFSICAFLGWIIQAIYDIITKKKIVNSGFLYGPFIPLYGFVALIVYFFNLYLDNLYLPVKLLAFFIIPTAVEYFTGYLLEKIFYVKLWDYSEYKFNIKGRVALIISLGWFMLVLLQVFVIQRLIFDLLYLMPALINRIIAIILLVYFFTDGFFSFKVFYYFSKIKEKIKIFNFNLKEIEINKNIIKKMKYISGKIRISPTLKSNFKKEIGEFIEKLGKNKKREF